MRMQSRRFTRVTNSFSQKFETHVGGGSAIVQEPAKIELRVGAAFISIEAGHVRIDNGGGSTIDMLGGLVVVRSGTRIDLNP